ncbi:FAD-dependent monooxygenase [Streptomyces sp. ODS05-4]|uniref:FAD-dependent monooxygenase n=1 Tax=Streptomyces sp. ODS05-4 TaxID=2944939 RepID=UPI00210935F6|nr:FAD-dependent monooxygenase [Streptomyces sp. ODS05-4]
MDPVIVVGAGPVGLALALALAAHEVPSVVLDEGPGKDDSRPARTAVLREDTAGFLEHLGCAAVREEGVRWTGWHAMRRRQRTRHVPFAPGSPAPLHIAQHALTSGLRDAIAALTGAPGPSPEPLVRVVTHNRLDAIEQDADGVTAHTRGPEGAWWRGSHLVGCDGARSTVRKLLGVRFPGRTAVERHAVATLRTELPWPGEGVLHRQPAWRGADEEVTARPLPGGAWRLDWLLPPRGDLVTPDALVGRIRDTLADWCGQTPPYDLVDTGVYTLHHRLAQRWRVERAFLAGDAAHLLGALGTQGLDEGLRDVANLAWKLALVRHGEAPAALLDSYQAERRTAVAARLRAADQSLPVLRGTGGLRTYLRGAGHDALLTDGHVGRGPLGAPPAYPHSPLAPAFGEGRTAVATPDGAPVEYVRVTAPDGTTGGLRERLGRRRLLAVLVAPGTGVWDRRHWMSAGVMPKLAEAVAALPLPAEVLVTESYPGASAHTVLLVRPDGHLAAAFAGVRPAGLRAAVEALRGEAAPAPRDPGEAEDGDPPAPPGPAVPEQGSGGLASEQKSGGLASEQGSSGLASEQGTGGAVPEQGDGPEPPATGPGTAPRPAPASRPAGDGRPPRR